jgi:hypothetical protein
MYSRAGIFSHFRNSDRLVGYLPLVRRTQYSLARTFHRRRSGLLRTGFLTQVRKLKIQRKNPGGALQSSATEHAKSPSASNGYSEASGYPKPMVSKSA